MIADLKKNCQGEYKARVRAARLMAGTSQGAMASARRESVHQYINTLAVRKGISEVSGVLWMNKDEFVGHQITVLGQSRADGEAFWHKEVRNPQRAKRGSGGDLRLAVQAIPRTEATIGVVMTRSLGHAMEVDLSGRDGEARPSQIGETMAPAALPDLASSDAFSAMDRSGFAFGAASSSSGQSNPLSHLSAGSAGRTFLGDLARPSVPLLALGGAETPRRTTRKLRGQLSDPGTVSAGTRAEATMRTRTVWVQRGSHVLSLAPKTYSLVRNLH